MKLMQFLKVLSWILGGERLSNEVGALGNWPNVNVEDAYDAMFDAYDEVPSKIGDICEIKTPSEGSYDKRTSVIGAGKLTQKATEDTSVTYRRPSEGYTAYCVYRNFDDGFSLTKNEVEDIPPSKINDIAQGYARGWGNALVRTEEVFLASLFKNGGKTAGSDDFNASIPGGESFITNGLSYDAEPAFNLSDNTRSSKGGGTYYNAIQQPLNVTNYGTLYELMFATNAYDERDEEIETASQGTIALIYPPQLHDSAVQALESEFLPGSDLNDKNPWARTAKLLQWGYLRANATTWYIQVLKMGIRFYRRGKPELRYFRDEDTGRYMGTCRSRYGWMFWNFRYSGGSNVPTS